MKKPLLTIGMLLALLVPLFGHAGTKEGFQKVYSEAESTNKNAGNFQWTVTSDRLKAAKLAAESGDYEKAKAMATEALNLAEASLAQRKEQGEVWRNATIGN